VIATIRDRIKRDAYMRKLATIIRIDERLLYEELQQVLRSQKAVGVTAAFSAPVGQHAMETAVVHDEQIGQKSDWTRDGSEVHKAEGSRGQEVRLDRKKSDRVQWEDYLIGLLLQNPGLSLHICAIITDGDFAGTDTRELYRILNSLEQRGSSPFHQPIEQSVPAILLPTVSRAQKCVESRLPKDGAGLVKEAVQCATRLKRTRLLQSNKELEYLIREAGVSGDKVSERMLLKEMLDIQKQVRVLDLSIQMHG
jgi:DNA primase